MFYEVKVLGPKGDLKKVVPAKELSKIFWNTFNKSQPAKMESLILLREYKKQIKSADYHSGGGTQS